MGHRPVTPPGPPEGSPRWAWPYADPQRALRPKSLELDRPDAGGTAGPEPAPTPGGRDDGRARDWIVGLVAVAIPVIVVLALIASVLVPGDEPVPEETAAGQPTTPPTVDETPLPTEPPPTQSPLPDEPPTTLLPPVNPPSGAPPGANPPPDEWDPLLVDLVDFVEAERELDFTAPVAVEFLPDEVFLEQFRYEDLPFFDEALDSQVALRRAVGAVEGDLDIGEQMTESAELGALAYYEQFEDVIYLRESVGGAGDRSAFQRAVLVHELTHALQDQHFDLAEWRAEADQITTTGMIVEGDARRIERAYVDQLSADEQTQYWDTMTRLEQEAAEAGFTEILLVEGELPYAAGSVVTDLVATVQGSAGVDTLTDRPPLREAQTFRASTVFLGSGDPTEEPFSDEDPYSSSDDPPVSATILEPGFLGAWMWYAVLTPWIGAEQALAVADGIGADGYLLYEDRGRVCVNLSIDPLDGHEEDVRRGLEEWVGALRQGGGVTSADEQLRVNLCDPGPSAPLGVTAASIDVLDVPLGRIEQTARALEAVASSWDGRSLETVEAYCLADTVQGSLDLDEMHPDARLSPDRLSGLGEAAVAACLE